MVPVGIVEIEPATTVACIDLALVLMEGIGPKREPTLTDAGEDRVEIVFGYPKGIMLERDPVAGFEKIETCASAQPHHREWPKRFRRGQAKDLRQENGRGVLVFRPDNGVIQVNVHNFLQRAGAVS